MKILKFNYFNIKIIYVNLCKFMEMYVNVFFIFYTQNLIESIKIKSK
jgi:hypothetical protein